jgi:hypothetical protein
MDIWVPASAMVTNTYPAHVGGIHMNTYFMEEFIMDYKFMNEEMLNNMQAIEESNQKRLMESFKMIDIMFSMTKEYFGDDVLTDCFKFHNLPKHVASIKVKFGEDEMFINFSVYSNGVRVGFEIKEDDRDVFMPIATVNFKSDISGDVIIFESPTIAKYGNYRVKYVLTLEEKKKIFDCYLALSNALEHAFKLGLLGEKFDKENFDK